MSLAILLASALNAAWAHPFGDRYAAVSTLVEARPDRVEVTLIADVPLPLLQAVTRAEDDPDRFLELLPTTVRLTVDDDPVPLRVVDADHAPDLVFGHAEIFTLRLQADVPLAGTHHIAVDMGALAAVPVWLRSGARLPAGATVLDDGLGPIPGDHRDLRQAWTRSRRARRWSLTTHLPSDPLSDWIRTSLPPVDARDAVAMDAGAAWRTGRVDRRTVPLATALALLLGAGLGAALSESSRRLGALSLGLLGAALAPAGSTRWLAALALALALPPLPTAHLVAVVLGVAWCGAALPWPLSLAPLTAGVLGAGLLAVPSARLPRRHSLVALAMVATVAALRG